jgi:hypothetical protein
MLRVAIPVASELWLPILATASWYAAFPAPVMKMPEAAMDEDDLPVARHDNVGTSWKIGTMQPETKTKAMDEAPDRHLWRHILAADLAHVRAPPGGI